MGAYYNEIDPHKVAWLRNLIKAGLIADGESRAKLLGGFGDGIVTADTAAQGVLDV